MTSWLGSFNIKAYQIALDGQKSQRDGITDVDFVASGQASDHALLSLLTGLDGPSLLVTPATYAMFMPGKERRPVSSKSRFLEALSKLGRWKESPPPHTLGQKRTPVPYP